MILFSSARIAVLALVSTGPTPQGTRSSSVASWRWPGPASVWLPSSKDRKPHPEHRPCGHRLVSGNVKNRCSSLYATQPIIHLILAQICRLKSACGVNTLRHRLQQDGEVHKHSAQLANRKHAAQAARPNDDVVAIKRSRREGRIGKRGHEARCG